MDSDLVSIVKNHSIFSSDLVSIVNCVLVHVVRSYGICMEGDFVSVDSCWSM